MANGKIDIPKVVRITDLPPTTRIKTWQENEAEEKKQRTKKWDKRFLELAELISRWSKDPSTKCGCVIVRPDMTIASLGYNGFPRNIEDKQELYDNREEKYKRVIHGEMNAILNAREPLHGYTLYTHPGPCSCERCTVHIIQAGIKRVVCSNKDPIHAERWCDSVKLGTELYKEAGVKYEVINENKTRT